jgi:hypothetical protein
VVVDVYTDMAVVETKSGRIYIYGGVGDKVWKYIHIWRCWRQSLMSYYHKMN